MKKIIKENLAAMSAYRDNIKSKHQVNSVLVNKLRKSLKKLKSISMGIRNDWKILYNFSKTTKYEISKKDRVVSLGNKMTRAYMDIRNMESFFNEPSSNTDCSLGDACVPEPCYQCCGSPSSPEEIMASNLCRMQCDFKAATCLTKKAHDLAMGAIKPIGM